MGLDQRQVTGFKFRPDVRRRLEEMAETGDRSMTAVVTAAVNRLYDEHVEQRRFIEERATRGMALLARVEERLGEKFYRGCGEVGFELTPQGRVLVHVGNTRYFEEGGKLVAARVRGDSADFSPIGPNGELDWMSTPIGTPAMN